MFSYFFFLFPSFHILHSRLLLSNYYSIAFISFIGTLSSEDIALWPSIPVYSRKTRPNLTGPYIFGAEHPSVSGFQGGFGGLEEKSRVIEALLDILLLIFLALIDTDNIFNVRQNQISKPDIEFSSRDPIPVLISYGVFKHDISITANRDSGRTASD